MTQPYRKKLIEVALPLKAINEASAREKSIRHGHPSTLHLWWARRPLAACRAVLFASLVDDPDSDPAYRRADGTVDEDRAVDKREQLFNLIEELVRWETSNNPRVINAARAEIARCVASRKIELGELAKDMIIFGDKKGQKHPKGPTSGDGTTAGEVVLMQAQPEVVNAFLAEYAPPVLDPFCGGGSIPLEAQRLGLRAYASDLNPVPVLITKALIEIPPKFAGRPPVNPEARASRLHAAAGTAALPGLTTWQGAQGLAEDVRYYGQWMRDEAEKRIGHLYPKVKITKEMVAGSVGVSPASGQDQDRGGQDGRAPRPDLEMVAGSVGVSPASGQDQDRGGQDGRAPRPDLEEYVGQELTVIAWLWARTVASPNPACGGAHVPLVHSFWLSTKKGKEAYVEPIIDRKTNSYRFVVRTGKPRDKAVVDAGTKLGRGCKFRCLLSDQPIDEAHIKDAGTKGELLATLLAVVAEGAKGRVYLSPGHVTSVHVDRPSDLKGIDAPLADDPRNLWCLGYGLNTFDKLFTPRQLVALTTFSDLVQEARAKVLADALGARASRPHKAEHDRGYLPHWEAGETPQFITFRLADALPRRLLDSWKQELAHLSSEQRDLERRKRIEAALDQGHGACILRNPQIARLVENALLHFDGTRYRLHAWIIMPNHVHVLITPLHGNSLSSILHSWKSFSAKEVNKLLGRTGQLWQEEYFDRMIRDDTHWHNAMRYIEENPVTARLCERPEDWPFGSACRGEEKRAGRPRSQEDLPLADGGTGPQAYADALMTYLAFGVSKLADRGSTISSWDSSRSTIRSTFGRQALPMTWHFAEGNPFCDSTGNWTDLLEWGAKSVLGWFGTTIGCVKQLDATAAINGVERPMISTDPPYYDNIGYADLSDFFYVWLRRSLKSVYPSLFATVLTPKAQELIASPYRHAGDKQKAQEFFETGLGKAFARMHEAHTADYPLTVYYAFKQQEDAQGARASQEGAQGARASRPHEEEAAETVAQQEDAQGARASRPHEEEAAETVAQQEDAQGARASRPHEEEAAETAALPVSTGWETMLAGLIRSGFAITGTWPMRTELGNRMIGMGTNALASSIVLVCRPRPGDTPLATRKEFINALRQELPEALKNLQRGNIAPVDMAQAAIGPGMAVFTRYSKVIESDGSPMTVRTALGIINQVLDEVLAEQEGDFDPDTRWALAWFDQHGMEEGSFGIAETLSKAKNTAVNGLVVAGVVKAKGGKVQLVKREELPETWDPATDRRLTVWETTQHLIRTLQTRGEGEAATLLNKLGGLGETARELAYRLYSICERKKWADEALAYNSLVIAWPELSKLALSSRNRQSTTQQDLFT
jgi:putative DNA methylase